MSSTRAHPVPPDEAERLRALKAYAVLDTSREKDFDDIVELAARIFNAPIAMVSLVDAHRQFFKAYVGVDGCQASREGSFCTYTILGSDVLVVLDATKDERFVSSPFVVGSPNVRFYAGAPLITPSGATIGSLCLIDTSSRSTFSTRDRDVLVHMARLVMERLELRRLKRTELDGRIRFDTVAAASPDAIVCATGDNLIVSWNKAAERMFGYTAPEAVGLTLDLIIPPTMHRQHGEGIGNAAAGGETKLIGSLVTVQALRRDGQEFPVELSLSRWRESGNPMFGAILRDITDRRREEARLRYAAEFDNLTDLANRTVLSEKMQVASRSGASSTVLLLDLDGFKDVNDSLGHAAGDEVLKVVAGRLLDVVGSERHLVCRLGGDEFVIFITGSADPLYAAALGKRLIAEIERLIRPH